MTRSAKSEKSEKRSRRRFLQSAAAAGVAASFPLVLASRKARAADTITLLAWYGNGEPDVVGAFEEANNVKVESKYYTGGDNMLALIAQSPPGTYDVVLSDAEYVTQLRAAGYLEKLDPGDYPLDSFFPEFQKFPVPGFWEGDDLYALPVSFGFLGVTYNTDVVDAAAARTYELLWDASVRDRVGHFDWYLPNFGCLSLRDGNAKPYEISDAAFAALRDTALSLRPQVRGFFDYGGVLSSLRSGEVVAMCGIGDWITGVLQKDGAPVDTVIPREGGIQFTEGLALGKNSRRPELAKKLIQYFMSPRGQVRKALMQAYPTAVPNREAWEILNRENPGEAKRARMQLSAHNMIDDIRSGDIHLRRLPARQSLEDWNDLWLEYKNAG
ncbi:MAG: polyamine ABC transporter substrate-binding protein [Gammaproteobacteria bacterium]